MTVLKPGRKIKELTTVEGANELTTFLTDKRFNQFLFTVLYGAGAVKNHIVVGEDLPVSLCGRFCSSVSEQPHVTIYGVMCWKCFVIYKRTFLRWLETNETNTTSFNTVEAGEVKEIVETLKTIISLNNDWAKAITGIEIPVK